MRAYMSRIAEPDRGPSASHGRLYVLGAAVLWSTSGAAIKSTAALTAWQIAGGRALFAALVVLALVPEARRGLLRPNARTLAVAAAYAATTVLFVFANTLTTSANAIFLQDTAPLWVLLLGPLLLGERPSRAELFLAPVYLAGISLFFVEKLGPAGGATGNVVALLSGVAFGLLIIGLRGLRAGGAEAAVAAGNLLAAAACAPFAVPDLFPIAARDVAIVAFLGIFQHGIAYVLFVRGLRAVSALEGSLLALLEPVLNPIWAVALAGERPGPFALTGGGIILAATLARLLVSGRRAVRTCRPRTP